MFEPAALIADATDKPVFYAELAAQAEALLHGEHDRIANAANLAALIWMQLPDLNWAGFYFFDGRELVVGRSEEHTSELQSLMRISYAVFCLKKKKQN